MKRTTRPSARRPEQDAVQQKLNELARRIEEDIPAEWRSTVANALCCIAQNGYLFAIACGKAAVLRSAPEQWGSIRSDFWPFIDRQNAEFARHMLPDIVASWNTPFEPKVVHLPQAVKKAS